MRTMWKLLLVPGVVVLGGCVDEGPTAVAEGSMASYSASQAAGKRSVAQSTQSPTIVDVAVAVNAETGEFSTLIAAVVAADLVGALSANGQRTVFAPTDAAFAALGLDAGNIAALPKEALANILLYHVAPGRREAASVVGATRMRMANGGFTRLSVQNGDAFINAARIVATDVAAGNGMIHVIDGVLLP